MAIEIEKRGNDAVYVNGYAVNGGYSDISLTQRGSSLYWAIFAIMLAATLVFLGMGMRRPRATRIFHYITAGVTMVATIAYFTMASHLGWTPIQVEFQRSDHHVAGTFREIYYVRYIDWAITTPLLLLDLLLTASMPWPTILWVILVDLVMIVTGLIGALTTSSYKWGYFTFGCLALFYIIYQLGFEARRHAHARGADVGLVFLQTGTLTLVLWILYPIAWGVSEGGNLIAPDSEAIFYSVLDVLAKPVFGALLIWGHRSIDPMRLGLHIRDYDDDPAVHTGRHHGVGHHKETTTTV